MSDNWATDDWGADDFPERAGVAEPVQDASTDESEPEAPRLYFGSVDEFVRDYLCQVYRRQVGGVNARRIWAGRWWQYDEAVIRLEALWRAWEHLRLDPSTGMSVWWRDHADHHMPALFDVDGAFAGVDENSDENKCKAGAPLPYVPPPDGMFPDVREPSTA